jgi:hypothetical protein
MDCVAGSSRLIDSTCEGSDEGAKENEGPNRRGVGPTD